MARELGDSKKALVLAQKAFYDQDPEAIELLQLSDEEPDQSTIYLEENEEKTQVPSEDVLTLE